MATTSSEKLKKKSYTWEFKLRVINLFQKNNLYKTSKFFSLNPKTILQWTQDERSIRKAEKSSKHSQHQKVHIVTMPPKVRGACVY